MKHYARPDMDVERLLVGSAILLSGEGGGTTPGTSDDETDDDKTGDDESKQGSGED